MPVQKCNERLMEPMRSAPSPPSHAHLSSESIGVRVLPSGDRARKVAPLSRAHHSADGHRRVSPYSFG
jgi:hypothetical protein